VDDIAHIAAALEPSGLTVRGAINFSPEEGAPPGPDGGPARCVLLIGNVGGTFWPIFQKWRAEGRASIRNPLDNWSAEVIANIAKVFGARAVSPSDRPFLPFQQWAMRAEGLRPSPLGILMHPRYGLWHAYRGALLFSRPLDAPEKAPTVPHPCDSCVAKPCLHACPASAHSLTGFDYSCCRPCALRQWDGMPRSRLPRSKRLSLRRAVSISCGSAGVPHGGVRPIVNSPGLAEAHNPTRISEPAGCPLSHAGGGLSHSRRIKPVVLSQNDLHLGIAKRLSYSTLPLFPNGGVRMRVFSITATGVWS